MFVLFFFDYVGIGWLLYYYVCGVWLVFVVFFGYGLWMGLFFLWIGVVGLELLMVCLVIRLGYFDGGVWKLVVVLGELGCLELFVCRVVVVMFCIGWSFF